MRKTNTARVFDVCQVSRTLSKEMGFVKESLTQLQKSFDDQSSQNEVERTSGQMPRGDVPPKPQLLPPPPLP